MRVIVDAVLPSEAQDCARYGITAEVDLGQRTLPITDQPGVGRSMGIADSPTGHILAGNRMYQIVVCRNEMQFKCMRASEVHR